MGSRCPAAAAPRRRQPCTPAQALLSLSSSSTSLGMCHLHQDSPWYSPVLPGGRSTGTWHTNRGHTWSPGELRPVPKVPSVSPANTDKSLQAAAASPKTCTRPLHHSRATQNNIKAKLGQVNLCPQKTELSPKASWGQGSCHRPGQHSSPIFPSRLSKQTPTNSNGSWNRTRSPARLARRSCGHRGWCLRFSWWLGQTRLRQLAGCCGGKATC